MEYFQIGLYTVADEMLMGRNDIENTLKTYLPLLSKEEINISNYILRNKTLEIIRRWKNADIINPALSEGNKIIDETGGSFRIYDTTFRQTGVLPKDIKILLKQLNRYEKSIERLMQKDA